jgi:hypothetical protein
MFIPMIIALVHSGVEAAARPKICLPERYRSKNPTRDQVETKNGPSGGAATGAVLFIGCGGGNRTGSAEQTNPNGNCSEPVMF